MEVIVLGCIRPNYLINGKFVSGERLKDNTYINDDIVPIPCGSCIECLKAYSNEWSYRVMSEFNGVGCVITLTYDNENYVQSISKRDVQLFLKRLRRRIEPIQIRYFGCGEYGTRNKRPHYHLIILNYQPSDLQYIKTTKKGTKLYRSRFIEDVWSKGIVSISALTAASVKYSAKYLQKLYFDEKSGLTPPFIMMSTHPSIGYNQCIELIKNGKFELDRLYNNGRWIKLPRQYLRIAEKLGYEKVDFIKNNRKDAAKHFSNGKKGAILLSDMEKTIFESIDARGG